MNDKMIKYQEQPMMNQAAGEIINQGKALQHVRGENISSVSVMQPRLPIGEIQKYALEECRLAPEKLTYAYTVRNKDGSRSIIEGPSVKLAMILARLYGNCSISTNCIEETRDKWVFEAIFVDRQTSFETKVQFEHFKPKSKRGKFDMDRVMQASFLIGQSKAKRKAIFEAMPPFLVKRAFEVAKDAVGKIATEKAGGIFQAVDKLKPYFARYGVDMAMLEQKIGKSWKTWNEQDIGLLRRIAESIKDGITSVENEFFYREPPPPKDEDSSQNAGDDDFADKSNDDEMDDGVMVTEDGEIIDEL